MKEKILGIIKQERKFHHKYNKFYDKSTQL